MRGITLALNRFLSTPSARRATQVNQDNQPIISISIHALREEGDGSRSVDVLVEAEFLSTPSARRATKNPRHRCQAVSISIHALREEGDASSSTPSSAQEYFYPRPPRGGRPASPRTTSPRSYFYPRPPRGGRLAGDGGALKVVGISIHALREEGDLLYQRERRRSRIFLSTPSARRATRQHGRRSSGAEISIHALREEGDAI